MENSSPPIPEHFKLNIIFRREFATTGGSYTPRRPLVPPWADFSNFLPRPKSKQGTRNCPKLMTGGDTRTHSCQPPARPPASPSTARHPAHRPPASMAPSVSAAGRWPICSAGFRRWRTGQRRVTLDPLPTILPELDGWTWFNHRMKQCASGYMKN
jgi:hypothetical protein